MQSIAVHELLVQYADTLQYQGPLSLTRTSLQALVYMQGVAWKLPPSTSVHLIIISKDKSLP